MQHPIDPAIDFNSIRDAIESMLVGRDQLVDDRDMQNILIAILEYSRQQRAVCQNPYINNATNTWYVYDSNGNPYDTNVSAEGTIIRQTEAQSIEGDPRVTLAQIDPMKPNEMKMTIYIPKGERGESGSVVTIVDGYWYIDGVNTGVVATGEAPTISEDGYWVVGGEKTEFKAVGTDGRDGVDGYSPTATVVKTGDTATIEITDKNGTTTATISDGFSPEVEVIQGDNSATINITDKTGQHTATILGGSYVPLYSTEKDWENRANWGNHYRVLMYGKQGYIECYSTGIVPIYMCPRYQPPKLSTYTGDLNGQCYDINDTSGDTANITLLCSTYLNTGNSCNIHEIDIFDTKIIDSGHITYNGLKCDPGTTFKGVENVTTFTSTNGAKVYAYPLTEPPVEIEKGNIEKDAEYIVKLGETYITYNDTEYYPGDIFRGIKGVIDFTPSGKAKVYTSIQPNGNASVSTSKPWKQEEILLMFYTDDKAKISNYCYDFYGNPSKYDKTSNEDGWEWKIGLEDVSYGIFKILSINGDLFFAVDMRNVDINNSADSEDIYGNWESVENEHSGDTTKDIANFTLLLDVVENDLTPLTTNNDSPAIEQE